MQKEILIETNDNYNIYGTLDSTNNNDNLIIFVHGLTWNQNEHVFYNSAKFFPNNWYNTFRFDLYTNERPLSDLSVKDHIKDLNIVLSYFEWKYKNIYLIWHSLGWPVILWSNINNIKAIVLWDPTINAQYYVEKICTYNKELDKYILNREIESILSKEMVNERKNIDESILDQIIKPTKIICAWEDRLKDEWKSCYTKITVDHEFIIIEEADHCFNQDWVEEKLFKETLSRLNKY